MGRPGRGFAGFLKISRKLPSSNVVIPVPYGHNEYMTENSEPISNIHHVGDKCVIIYTDEGRYTTFATQSSASGATYMAVSDDGAVSIHWASGIYRYEGGNALAIVAHYAATMSMGKTANYVKRTSTLVNKTPKDADGNILFDEIVSYRVAA